MMTSAVVFAFFVTAAALFNVVAWRQAQQKRQAAVMVRVQSRRTPQN